MGLVSLPPLSRSSSTLENVACRIPRTSGTRLNRRRSQRVLMTLPVRVSGRPTRIAFWRRNAHAGLSAHGAIDSHSTQVYRGQRLTCRTSRQKRTGVCCRTHSRSQGEHPQAGVESRYRILCSGTWPFAKRWTPRHPDANPRKNRDSS